MSLSKEMYCVLPGQPSVRLATIDGGHSCIISEKPRVIPDFFETEALSKGCLTESMVEGLKARLTGTPSPAKADEEVSDADRAAKIRTATIEILNAGDPTTLTSGKPKVDVLSAKAGFEVTGAERDSAFSSINQ